MSFVPAARHDCLVRLTGNIIHNNGYRAIPDITGNEGSEPFLSISRNESWSALCHDPLSRLLKRAYLTVMFATKNEKLLVSSESLLLYAVSLLDAHPAK